MRPFARRCEALRRSGAGADATSGSGTSRSRKLSEPTAAIAAAIANAAAAPIARQTPRDGQAQSAERRPTRGAGRTPAPRRAGARDRRGPSARISHVGIAAAAPVTRKPASRKPSQRKRRVVGRDRSRRCRTASAAAPAPIRAIAGTCHGVDGCRSLQRGRHEQRRGAPPGAPASSAGRARAAPSPTTLQANSGSAATSAASAATRPASSGSRCGRHRRPDARVDAIEHRLHGRHVAVGDAAGGASRRGDPTATSVGAAVAPSDRRAATTARRRAAPRRGGRAAPAPARSARSGRSSPSVTNTIRSASNTTARGTPSPAKARGSIGAGGTPLSGADRLDAARPGSDAWRCWANSGWKRRGTRARSWIVAERADQRLAVAAQLDGPAVARRSRAAAIAAAARQQRDRAPRAPTRRGRASRASRATDRQRRQRRRRRRAAARAVDLPASRREVLEVADLVRQHRRRFGSASSRRAARRRTAPRRRAPRRARRR